MKALATRRPARQPGLVSLRTCENDQYVIRNRATGESFQVGAEEHFLLERLDGRRTNEHICQVYADRFGEPLSVDELDEFIELSSKSGLLQAASPPVGGRIMAPGPLEQNKGTPANATAKPAFRARCTIQLLKRVLSGLRCITWMPNDAARRIAERIRHLEFVPRPDDVFTVTYPRSGTTWMQMILYQLTTDGSMEFPHIAEYCPWFERSLKARRAFETRPAPRLFKSHLPYSKIPKGPCKFIYVARDGKDVAVSYYHLYRTYNSFDGSFDQFFKLFIDGKIAFGSWFEHVEGWWIHRDDPNVLFLTYEELQGDLEASIRRVAAFIGRELSSDRMSVVLQRCGFNFMKQHEEKFDPAMESLWEQGVQLKSFLRQGRVGNGAVCLTDDQKARFAEAFGNRLHTLGIPLP